MASGGLGGNGGGGGGGGQGSWSPMAVQPSQPNWQLSYNLKPSEHPRTDMPEPQHRTGPPGVSSGVSLRQMRPVNTEEIRRICQHYEEKCGGQYASDSPAARYVFEMAREVRSQLGALDAADDQRAQRLASLAATMEEWEASFGPDAPLLRDAEAGALQLPPLRGPGEAAAKPAATAAALRTQADRIRQLEADLMSARKTQEASMEGLKGALASHLAASANSGEEERHRHEHERRGAQVAHDKTIQTIREQHDQAMQQVIQEKDAEFHKMAESYKKQLNDVQLELLNNRQHMINTEAQWRKRVEDVEQRERAEMARVKDHYGQLLQRARSEAVAAHTALESGGGGAMTLAGGAGGAVGGAGGGGTATVREAERARSLELLLDESRKEGRWLRDRYSEMERVVEALRKTIMRQAELSSQRQDYPAPGGGGGGGGSGGGPSGSSGGYPGHTRPPHHGARHQPPPPQQIRRAASASYLGHAGYGGRGGGGPPYGSGGGGGGGSFAGPGGGGAGGGYDQYDRHGGAGTHRGPPQQHHPADRGDYGRGPPPRGGPGPAGPGMGHQGGGGVGVGGGGGGYGPDGSGGGGGADGAGYFGDGVGSSRGPSLGVEVPDRAWSRSAPLPEGSAIDRARVGGGGHLPGGELMQPAPRNAWDRDPPRNTSAFLTMPLPPGLPSQSHGSNAVFDVVYNQQVQQGQQPPTPGQSMMGGGGGSGPQRTPGAGGAGSNSGMGLGGGMGSRPASVGNMSAMGGGGSGGGGNGGGGFGSGGMPRGSSLSGLAELVSESDLAMGEIDTASAVLGGT